MSRSGTSFAPYSTLRSRDARANATRWDLAADGLPVLPQSGLTTAGGSVAATVAGTDGTAILPVWEVRRDFRATVRVKATKATAGSKSYVGFTVSTPDTLPAAGDFTFGVGYLAGTGLAIIRENVGAPIVLLADASIVDGTLYDVAVWVDTSLGSRPAGGVGTIFARVKDTTGAEVAKQLGQFNLANFPVNNVIIRTNVAAGALTNLTVGLHPLAPVGGPVAGAGEVYYSASSGTETAFLHLPATPNGKLIIALHGHGGTPTETGWSSTTISPTWAEAVRRGYTVAVPALGADLWGNATAQGYLRELWSVLTTLYALDPEVYLWGNSMGGGAALTAIARKTIPVRSAYLAEPVCDLAAMVASGSFPDIMAGAYPDVATRNAYDPILQPAAAYAGVPMLFVASAADTTVPKATHTDRMRTMLAPVTTTYLLTATGNHADPSEFKVREVLDFFGANQ